MGTVARTTEIHAIQSDLPEQKRAMWHQNLIGKALAKFAHANGMKLTRMNAVSHGQYFTLSGAGMRVVVTVRMRQGAATAVTNHAVRNYSQLCVVSLDGNTVRESPVCDLATLFTVPARGHAQLSMAYAHVRLLGHKVAPSKVTHALASHSTRPSVA